MFFLFAFLPGLSEPACAFGKEQTDVFDAGSFFLERILLDGEAIDPCELPDSDDQIQPAAPSELTDSADPSEPTGLAAPHDHVDGTEAVLQNDGLYLRSDGTAVLRLGRESCETAWLEADTSFRLTFGTMTAEGEKTSDSITLTFGDTGLTYLFRDTAAGTAAAADNAGASATEVSADPLAGTWSGRLWFEDVTGEWSDYVYRSTALSGTVSEANASGQRTVSLYSPYFSDAVPMLTADFTEEGEILHCLSGYVMSYPVSEWAMEITLSTVSKSGLRSTVIIEKPGDYGHVFTQELDGTENEIVTVLRLTGTCRDADGSFRYVVELTEYSETDRTE